MKKLFDLYLKFPIWLTNKFGLFGVIIFYALWAILGGAVTLAVVPYFSPVSILPLLTFIPFALVAVGTNIILSKRMNK